MVERTHSRAPCRISFAGGGTDLEAYSRVYGGCVVSAAITRYAYVTTDDSFSTSNPTGQGGTELLEAVAARVAPGGKLKGRVDVPPLSGLGASGALAVAAVGALKPEMNRLEVVTAAYRAERENLGVAGGYQDQFVSAYGGILYLEFGNGRFNVEPVALAKETILDLEKHLVVVFVQSRTGLNSGDVLRDQLERLRKQENLQAHHRIKELALDLRSALRHRNMKLFAELLHEEWIVKKTFTPLISNDYIDGVYEFARRHGARAGKLMGAGAGGHLLLYCPETEAHVAQKLRELGLHPEPISFDWSGLTTWR